MSGYKYKKNNKIQYEYIFKFKTHEILKTNCQ